MNAPPMLTIDAGELEGEPEALYAAADLVHVACGGHAGDARSMDRVLEACARLGTRAGAHPSYVDREGFGRRPQVVAPDVLAAQVAEQCARLAEATRARAVEVVSAKPHGALYHAASADPEVARAVVAGVTRALGPVALVGPAASALESAAREAGCPFLREAFADRGVRPDGALVPRGEPGALVTDPAVAAARARELAARGDVETICVHGDTEGAVAIAQAVRAALGPKPREAIIEPFGERALRFALPAGMDRAAALALLKARPEIADVVLAEHLGAVVLAEGARADEVAASVREDLARAVRAAPPQERRTHVIRVAYDGEDLDAVAAATGLSRDEVVRAHSAASYEVAMLGFLPGFAYLRGGDPRLSLPRRASPRARVPARSVAVAAGYSAVYPFASPGGWHLLGEAIGFEPFGPKGAALAVGDRVRFSPEAREAPAAPRAVAARAVAAPEPGAPHVEIARVSGLAILVDRGRPGRMHEGVPEGGALVPEALARANLAAGNEAGACAIELCGALEIVARVVARGSVVVATCDGRARALHDGEALRLGPDGARRARYVAIRGGVDVPIVLGGRGTLLVAGLGGLDGRALRRGDALPIGDEVHGEPPSEPVDAPPRGPVAITLGPDAAPDALVEAILGATFRVSPLSDRTGTRLEGPALDALGATAPSAPMIAGAIQLTPRGLVVLGPDHPTTGGYPVVAVVRAASLGSLFARPVGAAVSFTR